MAVSARKRCATAKDDGPADAWPRSAVPRICVIVSSASSTCMRGPSPDGVVVTAPGVKFWLGDGGIVALPSTTVLTPLMARLFRTA